METGVQHYKQQGNNTLQNIEMRLIQYITIKHYVTRHNNISTYSPKTSRDKLQARS